jgi:predicted glutamine amidotransferase
MCGLTAAFAKRGKGHRRVGPIVFELYKKQEARGRRGYGFVAIRNGILVAVGRAKTEEAIKKSLMKVEADAILFHHRMPTSTDNTLGTTHPIYVSHDELKYDYYLAHNGVITNHAWLKGEHNELGYEYITEFQTEERLYYPKLKIFEESGLSVKTEYNDSETLAIEFARYIEGLSPRIRTVGGAAFWCVQVEKGNSRRVNNIYFGKNYGRTLGQSSNNKWLKVASELSGQTKEMVLYRLEDHSLVEVGPLPFDEAKPTPVYTPPPTVGFHNRALANHFNRTGNLLPAARTVEAVEVKKQPLHPALYSFEQKEASGHSFEDFICRWTGQFPLYVPKLYAHASKLKPLNEYLAGLKSEREERKKYEDMLQEYCTELVQLEAKYDLLEAAYDNRKIGLDYFQEKEQEFEARREQLEERVATLGFPDEDIEAMLELLREQETYQPTVFTYAD